MESSSTTMSAASKKIAKFNSKASKRAEKPDNNRKHTYWTKSEDAQLLNLIDQLGKKWTKIGQIIGDRTGKQVRERYIYTLNPDINRDKWTEEEDTILMTLYDEMGNKWSQMTAELPGRTENQIKNRYKAKIREGQSSKSTSAASQDSPIPEILSPVSPTTNIKEIPEFESSYQYIMEMSPAMDYENFSLYPVMEEIFSFENTVETNIDGFLSY